MSPGTKGIAVALAAVLVSLLLTAINDRLGLKYVQGVVWPTDLYTFQHTDFGPIDVAVLGSSRASFGLAPSAVDTCLTEALGRPTQTVNLGRTFATALTAQALTADLLTGDKVPKVLVLAVGPEFFNEHNHQLSVGISGHADPADVPRLLRQARDLSAVMAALRPMARGPENLTRFLAGRHRTGGHLRWMMLHHGGGQFCYGSPECQTNNDAVMRSLADRWQLARAAMLPRLQRQRFSQYEVGRGPVHEAVLEMIAWTRAQGSTLALVKLPLHKLFIAEIPLQAIVDYNAYVDQLVATYDLPVFETSSPKWLTSRQRYMDPDHLSDDGSSRLSRVVCRDLLSPLLSE